MPQVNVIGYGTYGSVRGFGPLRLTREHAEADCTNDSTACRRLRDGAYSDRRVVAVDMAGVCYLDEQDDESWVPGRGGRTGGAATYSRYAIEQLTDTSGT